MRMSMHLARILQMRMSTHLARISWMRMSMHLARISWMRMSTHLARILYCGESNAKANAYSDLFFLTYFFFIANYLFFVPAFFLGPYSERKFIDFFVKSFTLHL